MLACVDAPSDYDGCDLVRNSEKNRARNSAETAEWRSGFATVLAGRPHSPHACRLHSSLVTLKKALPISWSAPL